MKIIIFAFFIFASLLANNPDTAFSRLNEKIDTLSSRLSTEERASLYYLVLAAHDSSDDATKDALKERTLTVLESLRGLSKEEISSLKESYMIMVRERKELPVPMKKDSSSTWYLLLSAALSLIIGIVIGALFFSGKKEVIVQKVRT